MVHNHPSGNSRPSLQDNNLTRLARKYIVKNQYLFVVKKRLVKVDDLHSFHALAVVFLMHHQPCTLDTYMSVTIDRTCQPTDFIGKSLVPLFVLLLSGCRNAAKNHFIGLCAKLQPYLACHHLGYLQTAFAVFEIPNKMADIPFPLVCFVLSRQIVKKEVHKL